MASISVCFTTTPKPRHRSASIFLVPKPSALKPLKLSLSAAKARAFYGGRLTSGRYCVRTVVARAGADLDAVAPGLSRPGGVVESDKLPSDVRKRTMDAVDACGGRVTIGDVASRAGLKLDEAQKALQALAADTEGFLEVSDEGDVLYVFPKDYRSKLAAKSFRMKIEPLIEKGKSAAEYVIRVSFGTALIASIVIVYTTIIALLSSRSEEDNRGRRGRSYDSGISFYLSPTDLFWYWDPYYYRRRRARTENNGMNFIESIFSFVFGDGNPNEEIEEERWKLIGQYITANGGVVTAEELAPFLDVETSDRTTNDESYILPVLLRFDGQPEVDEEGNILYRFPSLQRTASSARRGRKEFVGKKWADWVGGAEKFLEEKKLEFSKTSASEKAMVIGLGGLNLFGVIVLGSMLKYNIFPKL
uniref:Iron-sulfur cluster biosynthesis family protein n=1 Tax=Kalanchoe fedtschenkoi TaxID=63787 RepID=A0A7N0RGF9_KALFE